MEVEWDPNKAVINLKKHGVSFPDAEAVLFDPNALSFEDTEAQGEQRFVVIGMDHLWRLTVRAGRCQYGAAGRAGGVRVIPQTGKTRITIYIDDDILDSFRERSESAGKGYQTLMNEALREYLGKVKQPIDEETLRRVIQEELRAVK